MTSRLMLGYAFQARWLQCRGLPRPLRAKSALGRSAVAPGPPKGPDELGKAAACLLAGRGGALAGKRGGATAQPPGCFGILTA